MMWGLWARVGARERWPGLGRTTGRRGAPHAKLADESGPQVWITLTHCGDSGEGQEDEVLSKCV